MAVMMPKRYPISRGRIHILLLVLQVIALHSCSAFMLQSSQVQYSRSMHGTVQQMTKSEPLLAQQPTQLKDKNDEAFSVGCTVQLCSEIRAYQVPAKARGSFSPDDNSFVQLENSRDAPRIDRCLVIPTGMRAKVSRLYDIDALDATQPILVKFEAGESFGGDYICPGNFMMHFDTNELEIVK